MHRRANTDGCLDAAGRRQDPSLGFPVGEVDLKIVVAGNVAQLHTLFAPDQVSLLNVAQRKERKAILRRGRLPNNSDVTALIKTDWPRSRGMAALACGRGRRLPGHCKPRT